MKLEIADENGNIIGEFETEDPKEPTEFDLERLSSMMRTVIGYGYATGEGQTLQVLYTKIDDDEEALSRFYEIFGYGTTPTLYRGLCFDRDKVSGLVPTELQHTIKRLLDAGSLEYYASLHFNFS